MKEYEKLKISAINFKKEPNCCSEEPAPGGLGPVVYPQVLHIYKNLMDDEVMTRVYILDFGNDWYFILSLSKL